MIENAFRLGARSEPRGVIARLSAQERDVQVSFEVLPPEAEESEASLWQTIRQLSPIGPHFVSIACQGSKTAHKATFRSTLRLLEQTRLDPVPHLTCVGATRGEVRDLICDYWIMGVRHVLAAPGRAPGAISGLDRSSKDSFTNVSELVRAITRIAPFEVTIGCYPEKHPDSPSFDHDIDVLKARIDAGATRAVTQIVFDVDALERFRERVRKAGISIPIVPGVVPVSSSHELARMVKQCRVSAPRRLVDQLEREEANPGSRGLVAAAQAAHMCATLQERGFKDFHFHTLNRADLAVAVCRLLGWIDQPARGAVTERGLGLIEAAPQRLGR